MSDRIDANSQPASQYHFVLMPRLTPELIQRVLSQASQRDFPAFSTFTRALKSAVAVDPQLERHPTEYALVVRILNLLLKDASSPAGEAVQPVVDHFLHEQINWQDRFFDQIWGKRRLQMEATIDSWGKPARTLNSLDASKLAYLLDLHPTDEDPGYSFIVPENGLRLHLKFELDKSRQILRIKARHPVIGGASHFYLEREILPRLASYYQTRIGDEDPHLPLYLLKLGHRNLSVHSSHDDYWGHLGQLGLSPSYEFTLNHGLLGLLRDSDDMLETVTANLTDEQASLWQAWQNPTVIKRWMKIKAREVWMKRERNITWENLPARLQLQMPQREVVVTRGSETLFDGKPWLGSYNMAYRWVREGGDNGDQITWKFHGREKTPAPKPYDVVYLDPGTGRMRVERDYPDAGSSHEGAITISWPLFRKSLQPLPILVVTLDWDGEKIPKRKLRDNERMFCINETVYLVVDREGNKTVLYYEENNPWYLLNHKEFQHWLPRLQAEAWEPCLGAHEEKSFFRHRVTGEEGFLMASKDHLRMVIFPDRGELFAENAGPFFTLEDFPRISFPSAPFWGKTGISIKALGYAVTRWGWDPQETLYRWWPGWFQSRLNPRWIFTDGGKRKQAVAFDLPTNPFSRFPYEEEIIHQACTWASSHNEVYDAVDAQAWLLLARAKAGGMDVDHLVSDRQRTLATFREALGPEQQGRSLPKRMIQTLPWWQPDIVSEESVNPFLVMSRTKTIPAFHSFPNRVLDDTVNLTAVENIISQLAVAPGLLAEVQHVVAELRERGDELFFRDLLLGAQISATEMERVQRSVQEHGAAYDPWVLASQLLLSKASSERLNHVFPRELLAGPISRENIFALIEKSGVGQMARPLLVRGNLATSLTVAELIARLGLTEAEVWQAFHWADFDHVFELSPHEAVLGLLAVWDKKQNGRPAVFAKPLPPLSRWQEVAEIFGPEPAVSAAPTPDENNSWNDLVSFLGPAEDNNLFLLRLITAVRVQGRGHPLTRSLTWDIDYLLTLQESNHPDRQLYQGLIVENLYRARQRGVTKPAQILEKKWLSTRGVAVQNKPVSTKMVATSLPQVFSPKTGLIKRVQVNSWHQSGGRHLLVKLRFIPK